MADNVLPIKLHLDRTAAEKSAADFRLKMQQLNTAMSADTAKALNADVSAYRQAADARTRAKAAETEGQLRVTRRAAEEEGTGIRSLKQARREAADEAVQGYGKMGKTGQTNFSAVAGAAGAALLVARSVASAISGITAELERVGAKSRQLSSEFASDRDKLRELAQVEGKKADVGFTLDAHRFARDAAMTFDEARGFRLAFGGSGAQFRQRTGDSEYEQFQKESAAFTAAKGVESGVSGNLAGTFLGFKDYGKKGGQAAETALADYNAMFAVLERGKGETSENSRQMSIIGASSLNEDETKGMFTDPTELAIAVSTSAESNALTSAEQLRAAIRGLRGKKAADLMKKAGVTPGTPFLETMEKIAPVVEAERQKMGPEAKTQDVLKKYFQQTLSQEAIATQLNRGVEGGAYADRRAVAAQAQSYGAAKGVIDTFQKDPEGAGPQRIAEADAKLAEAERAARNAELTTVRKQALAKLIRAGAIDTNATGINDYLNSKASFGAIGSAEAKRIDDETMRLLDARAPGGKVKRDSLHMLNVSPEARENELRGYIERMKRQGFNPVAHAEGEDEVIDRSAGGIGGMIGNIDALTRETVQPKRPGRPEPGANPSSGAGRPKAPQAGAGDVSMGGPTGLRSALAATAIGAIGGPPGMDMPSPAGRAEPGGDMGQVIELLTKIEQNTSHELKTYGKSGPKTLEDVFGKPAPKPLVPPPAPMRR